MRTQDILPFKTPLGFLAHSVALRAYLANHLA